MCWCLTPDAASPAALWHSCVVCFHKPWALAMHEYMLNAPGVTDLELLRVCCNVCMVLDACYLHSAYLQVIGNNFGCAACACHPTSAPPAGYGRAALWNTDGFIKGMALATTALSSEAMPLMNALSWAAGAWRTKIRVGVLANSPLDVKNIWDNAVAHSVRRAAKSEARDV